MTKIITIEGIVVELTQIADSNSPDSVYLLKAYGMRGWTFGRGDTRCIDILNNLKTLNELAENYLKTELTRMNAERTNGQML